MTVEIYNGSPGDVDGLWRNPFFQAEVIEVVRDLQIREELWVIRIVEYR